MAERRITGRVNNPGRLAAALGTPDFESAEQTVTVDTLLTVAHGLSAIPNLAHIILRCTTAANNYSQNDEIVYSALGPGSGAADQGITTFVDGTNVGIVQGVSIVVHDKSTFNISVITTSNYRWIIRAWS